VQTVVKSWHLLPHDASAIASLASALATPPIVAQLLLNRGVLDGDSARSFLKASLAGLHRPEALPGIREATDVIIDAINKRNRICVYGDYDVDGTTGTAILWQALHLLGASAEFYVPHRLEEGYGLNCAALKRIAESGAKVVVTVDCGIASLAEAEQAAQLGLDLVITDHHEFRERLPEARAVIHPRLPGTNYPFGGLSGAGVAFKLAWALCTRASGGERVEPRMREFLLDSVALAALGLVADVVPLHGENRIFVRHGLARIREAPSPGLKALLAAASLSDQEQLTAEDVSYKLAPRLNAVGRLGSARLVIELLTTTSQQRATDLARFIEQQNAQRQQVERRILARARELAMSDELAGMPALVLAEKDWHPGIIGIVASRLVELYARPALLIALHQDRTESVVVGHGSGRSIPGYPLHEALQACSEHLLNHGGHAAAAGFRIHPDSIPIFRKRFCAHVAQHTNSNSYEPRLFIDAEVPLSALTPGLLRDIAQLEPYGTDNRRPVFLATKLQIVGSPTAVGGGERHLSFRVRQQGPALRAIAFNMADRLGELMSANGACCLAFTPRINEWQGFRRVDLEVVDFQAGSEAQLG
jgi:single-stranded-DNA-specific exonuclease